MMVLSAPVRFEFPIYKASSPPSKVVHVASVAPPEPVRKVGSCLPVEFPPSQGSYGSKPKNCPSHFCCLLTHSPISLAPIQGKISFSSLPRTLIRRTILYY